MWKLQLSGGGSQELGTAGSDRVVTITAPVLPTGAAAAPSPASGGKHQKGSRPPSGSQSPLEQPKVFRMPSIGKPAKLVLSALVLHPYGPARACRHAAALHCPTCLMSSPCMPPVAWHPSLPPPLLTKSPQNHPLKLMEFVRAERCICQCTLCIPICQRLLINVQSKPGLVSRLQC